MTLIGKIAAPHKLAGVVVALLAWRCDPPFAKGRWILVNRNLGPLSDKKTEIEWLPSDTRFEWVRASEFVCRGAPITIHPIETTTGESKMSEEKRDLYIRAQILANGVCGDSSPQIHLSVWAIDGAGHHGTTDQYIWDAKAQTGAPDRHYRRLVASLRLNYDNSAFTYDAPYYDLDYAERSETRHWENFDRMCKTLKRIEKEFQECQSAKFAKEGVSYLYPIEFVEQFAKSVGAKGFIELGFGNERKITALSIGFAQLDHWMKGVLDTQKDGVAA